LNKVLNLNLRTDGVNGPQTRSAVRSFQQRYGLVVDGIVGPKTDEALRKALSAAGGRPQPLASAVMGATQLGSECQTLERFEYDKSALLPAHQAQVESLARRIVQSQTTSKPARTVTITGHTDPAGSENYNIGLGQRRAQGVRQSLRKKVEQLAPGVAGKINFDVRSLGETQPISQDAARNRRVEVCLSDKQFQPPANCNCVKTSLFSNEIGGAEAEAFGETAPIHRGHSLTMPSPLRPPLWLSEPAQDQFVAGGHEAVETDALSGLVSQSDCIRSVYFGNWQRDMSQVITPAIYEKLGARARAVYEMFFEMLDVMAEADFGRRLDRVRFGAYRWEEHIDNPREFCAPLSTCGAIDPRTYAPIPANSPRKEDAPEAHGLHFWTEGRGGLPNYLLASQDYVLNQLSQAERKGPTQLGLEHFGNAMHTVEDFYAHSNFIELCLNILDGVTDPKTGRDAQTGQPVLDSLKRFRLTTGVFLPQDTLTSINKIILGELEKGGTSTRQERIIRVLLRRTLGESVASIYEKLLSAWKRTPIAALQKKVEEQIQELVTLPIKKAIAELLHPLVEAAAQQTGNKAYPVVIGGRQFNVIEQSHSKLAKDDPKNPLHLTARRMASQAVNEFWREMASIWCRGRQIQGFRKLVDRYMNHPSAVGDWWKPLLADARRAQQAGMATTPAKPGVKPPPTPDSNDSLAARRQLAKRLIDAYVPSDTGDPRFSEIAQDYGGVGTTCGFLCHWLLWRLGCANREIVNRKAPGGFSYRIAQNISRIWNGGRPPFVSTLNNSILQSGGRPQLGDIVFIKTDPTIASGAGEHVFVFLEEVVRDGRVIWKSADAGQKNAAGKEGARHVEREFILQGRRGLLRKGNGERTIMGWLPLANLQFGPLPAPKSGELTQESLFEVSTGNWTATSDLSDAFFAELRAVSARLGANPKDLLGVMMSESGIRASAENRYSHAVGLIQFMPQTLVGLGWKQGYAAFKQLSAEQQLPYVERYFNPYKGYNLNSAGRLYQATFLPATLKLGAASETIIAEQDGQYDWAYAANKALDVNKDGRITIADLTAAVNRASRGPRWEEALARLEGRETPGGAQSGTGTGTVGGRPSLRLGLRGPWVNYAQHKLNQFSSQQVRAGKGRLKNAPLTEDGIYGPKTLGAVVSFQQVAFPSQPYEHDGVIGPKTWAKLEAMTTGNVA
jgi:peptidoglycan hydrolase-like protein with peptidoglycan-binding domain